MYDELIRSLRCCADNPCYDCKFRGIYMDSCVDTLKTEAADAIEELSRKYIEERNAAVELTGELASKPRWISVEDDLPEVFKHVLVNIPGMSPFPTVQDAFREKNGMWYSNGFRYGADEITHWMPLPKGPEEE